MRAFLLVSWLAACSSAPAHAPPAPRPAAPAKDPCSGGSFWLSQRTLEDDAWPCACHERETRTEPDGHSSVRAGDSCGARKPNETERVSAVASLAEPNASPGEDLVLTVRLQSLESQPASYRFATRHVWARLVNADGSPFADEQHASAPARDEARVELGAGGTITLELRVSGTYARFEPSGQSVAAVPRPGDYAIQVLGLEPAPALVPVHLRR